VEQYKTTIDKIVSRDVQAHILLLAITHVLKFEFYLAMDR